MVWQTGQRYGDNMSSKRKRLALFVGQADESYQSNFIEGFIESAFVNDMDVCVFSMYHKYHNTDEREKGEKNIFRLFEPCRFDAAVILEDTIQTADGGAELEEMLHESFDKTVLVVEKDSKYFPSVFTDSTESIMELVSHLIEVHGYTDIAFLSGKKWHKHSVQRLEAVRTAMEKHGLTLPENRVIYGDFWYNSGEVCADEMVSNGDLPQAVVCANDAMAIGLCKGLEERGIRIPEDVAVVSYDSTFEGQTSPKLITSSLIPAREFGSYSVEYVCDMMAGRTPKPFSSRPSLVIGETCGCKDITIPTFTLKRDEWGTPISEEGFDSVNNTMAEDLFSQTDLSGFLATVYSYAFEIKNAQSFHLCLCEPWKYIDKTTEMRLANDGYTDRMVHAVRYNRDRMEGIAGSETVFERSQLLPLMNEDQFLPRALFFTPVFFENNCFGYAVVEYDKPCSYDEIYRKWIAAVSRGFEGLRRFCAVQNIQEQMNRLRTNKFAAMTAAYESLSEDEREEYTLVGKILDENLFVYHFQPIVNTVDGGVFSYEALMRSDTDRKVPPLTIIKYADMQNRLVDVERATFLNVLRFVEDNQDEIGKAKIFINSIPGVNLAEDDMRTVETSFDKMADMIVVELTEEAEMGDEDLNRLKKMLGKHNVKIAVDDYGTGYSNVNNLLRYMPNIVKIDRALLSDISDKPQKQHFVKEIIGFCHDNGILALAEGIETSDELRTVIFLGADLIQGYYTGRPSPELVREIDPKIRDEIREYHKQFSEGAGERSYIAGRTNRVSLASLVKDGCSEIIVGQGTMIYKDITIYGAPSVESDVHIKIKPEYTGRITLENAYLSNLREHPCIELGAGCDVTLVLVGENKLVNSGIRVPPSASLTLEGDGTIRMDLYSSDYYGIGNRPTEAAGELIFQQDGTVDIKSHGANGVCIGSGMGGRIELNAGQYILDANGLDAVGIGSISGDAEVTVNSCNLTADVNADRAVCIGSLEGSTKVTVSKSGIRLSGDGTAIAGIGTVSGAKSYTRIDTSSAILAINGASATGIGALEGRTDFEVDSSLVKLTASGEKALSIGGMNTDQHTTLIHCDLKSSVNNNIKKDCFALPEDIELIDGSAQFILNGEQVR